MVGTACEARACRATKPMCCRRCVKKQDGMISAVDVTELCVFGIIAEMSSNFHQLFSDTAVTDSTKCETRLSFAR
jgi:hypothetical protein